MDRPSVATLLACLVLVVSMGAVPVPAGTMPSTGSPHDGATAATAPPTRTENTTARLTLPSYRITRSEFETVHLGAANTFRSSADGVQAQHERLTVERKFEAADSIDEKRSVIDRALIDLNDRAKALEARERAAIRNYSDGNITEATVVRELARIDASAREIGRSTSFLRNLAARENIRRFDTRIQDVEGRIESLQGPVRHRAARTMAGDEPPARIYFAASDRGIVLSMLTNGQYVREASYWANRNASAAPELDIGEIGTRIEELYPWTSSQGNPDVHWRGSGIWRFRATHSQGTMRAYVDASTGNVFREVQTLSVQDMPATTTVARNESGLAITLERTYVGGPLRIIAEHAATGAAVNARVTVDGHDLGNTGTDGLVWTIEPRPPYTVNASVDGVNVSFTVERPLDGSVE